MRISKEKAAFEQGYTSNWSAELFKIKECRLTKPATYLAEDVDGNPIRNAFYNEELQKAKYSDIYLVEKIVEKKGNKVFVKCLGFDKSHNSWINKKRCNLNFVLFFVYAK